MVKLINQLLFHFRMMNINCDKPVSYSHVLESLAAFMDKLDGFLVWFVLELCEIL